MRYLHAVGIAERFLAGGAYVDTADGASVERWSIHVLPDGAWLIRADHIPTNTLIELWRSPRDDGGRIERVDAFKLSAPTVRISLQRTAADTLDYGRTVGRDPRQYRTQTIPPEAIFSGRAIIGAAFLRAEAGGAESLTVATFDPDTLELQMLGGDVAYHAAVAFNAAGILRDGLVDGRRVALTDYAAEAGFALETA